MTYNRHKQRHSDRSASKREYLVVWPMSADASPCAIYAGSYYYYYYSKQGKQVQQRKAHKLRQPSHTKRINRTMMRLNQDKRRTACPFIKLDVDGLRRWSDTLRARRYSY
jgi:hypothetical protein